MSANSGMLELVHQLKRANGKVYQNCASRLLDMDITEN